MIGKLLFVAFPVFTVYVFIGEHVALVHLIRAMANKKLFDNGHYMVISVDDKLDLDNFFDVGKQFHIFLCISRFTH